MLIDLSTAVGQFEAAKKLWEKGSPSISPQENLQGLGVDVADVTHSFEEVLALFTSLDETDNVDPIIWLQHKGNLDSIPSAMTQFFQSH